MAFRLGEGRVRLGVDQGDLRRGLATARGALHGFASHATGALRRLMRLPTLVGGVGVAGVFGLSVKRFAEFEQGLARVKAISGATGFEFQKLRRTAEHLGRTTRFTAVQTSEAMGNLALAGFKANDIVEAMPSTLNLAAAGMLDMGTAAGIVAKAMRGMSMTTDELEHAVDVMVKAFTTAYTDLPQLGDAFRYVIPVAKAAGYTLEELTAALQLLSDAGIQASMAGTSMRRILIALGSARGATKLGEIGVQVRDATGALRDLPSILNDLQAAFDKLDPLARAEAMALFGLRAGPAMEVLLERGGDALAKYTKALADSGGTAKRIAAIQENTLKGAFTRLASAANDVAIAIGNEFAKELRSLTEWLTSQAPTIAEKMKSIARHIKAFFATMVNSWDSFKAWILSEVDYLIEAIAHKVGTAIHTGMFGESLSKIVKVGRPDSEALADAKYAAQVTGAAFREELAKQVAQAWGSETRTNIRTRGSEPPLPEWRRYPHGRPRFRTPPAPPAAAPPAFPGFPAVGGGAGGGGGGMGFMGASEAWRRLQSAAGRKQQDALTVAKEQRDLLREQLHMLTSNPKLYKEQLKVNNQIGALNKLMARWAEKAQAHATAAP